MLKKFLEQTSLMGYVINTHYDPVNHKIKFHINKNGREIENDFDIEYLHDDMKLVYALRELISKMEGAENG